MAQPSVDLAATIFTMRNSFMSHVVTRVRTAVEDNTGSLRKVAIGKVYVAMAAAFEKLSVFVIIFGLGVCFLLGFPSLSRGFRLTLV